MNITHKNSAAVKITTPRVSGIVRRKRLFDLIDKERDKPIVYVAAPAGSGKTTLISSYLDSKKLPCLWYQLDAGDADLATFFYYMGLAAKKANPSKRKPMPLLTPEYLQGIPIFTRSYFEELYSRLTPSRQGSGRYIIVLDNYQDVPLNSGFHEMLIYGLDIIPEGINVIIISRTEPPAQFARLRANGKINFIGWNEIRFTLEETELIVRAEARKHTSLEGKTARLLHEKTDGWAAGLVLMLEAAGTRGGRDAAAGSDDILSHCDIPLPRGEAVFDYFAGEIFDRADKNRQGFLLKTAFFPQMTAAMAEKLTGISGAKSILAELNLSNFFTDLHHVPGPVYQYHPLFREFLAARARELFSSDELAEMQNTAAELLEQAGYGDEAIELYRISEDWQSLVRLLLMNAPLLMQQGRSGRLYTWLSFIPEEVFENNPWLYYWKGMVRLMFDTAESRYKLDKAFQSFVQAGDNTGAFLSCAGMINAVFFERGDFSRMDRYIAWIDKTIGETLLFPSTEVQVRVVMSMLCAITFRAPHHHNSRKWLSKAHDMLEDEIDNDDKINLAANLHLYCIYTGDHRRARMIVTRFKHSAALKKLNPLTQIQWHLIEAMHYHMVDASEDDCFSAIAKGLELSEKHGIHILDFILLNIGAYGAVNTDKEAELKNFKDSLSALVPSAAYFDKGNYYCMLLCEDLNRDNFQSALQHARILLEITIKTESSLPLMLAHLGMAEALFETGKQAEAAKHLSLAKDMVKNIPDFKWAIIFLVPEAYDAFKTGSEKKGIRLLEKAFAQGRDQEYVNFLYWRHKVMSLLCAKALEHGIEVDYVKRLIRIRNITPPGPINSSPLLLSDKERMDGVIDLWPYPLKIYTLGSFGIVKDGVPLALTGKVRKKPLEMLKALIAFGGREVSEEILTEALWHEAEGDKAYQSFKFTIFALRKLIGIDDAIQIKNGCVTLNAKYCWVDAWAFQHILGEIEKTENKDFEKLIRLSEKAIGMYGGDFLAGETTQPWAFSAKERLKSKFIRLVRIAGNCREDGRDYQKAADYYEKALEVDDLEEEFYRRLMLCYIRLGNKAKAVSVFNRCRNTLSALLEISPSAETEALYKALIKSR